MTEASGQLGLGHGSAFGERGVAKRLGTLSRYTALSGRRLLEIGCGDGTYTMRLVNAFEQIEAVDIQQDRLELFRERLAGDPVAAQKINVRELSATELDYPDESFDLVTAIEVVEHIDDLDAALRQVHRVLVPGGRFALTTSNRWFPIETHGFLIRGKRYRPARGPFLPWIVPLHRRLADARSFTARGLSGQLRRAGLETGAVDYIMPPFDRSGFGQRIRPVTDAIERSPLKFFGMALAVVARRPD
ncbi:class I SAM-dependent methyltransferase [Micromonospora sp. WMMD980]|uniref:class I SAM-dependent methyltransferase n=1 Tax=Micromonospora sp. WMMD980 TaxID=3016088 RepID=UPI002417A945|nr:class I SAM-dependent methyltransferase [Micromonospora sp. WMMD980]MDG4802085.1 class I SAM-dependent methyltransferase [Micromonospora sp. WMMD980]